MYSSNFQPEASLRWKRVQSVLQSINADAVLLNTNANLYYSSGRVFNGYTYIPSEGEAIYFVRRPIGLKGENVHYIHKTRTNSGFTHRNRTTTSPQTRN